MKTTSIGKHKLFLCPYYPRNRKKFKSENGKYSEIFSEIIKKGGRYQTAGCRQRKEEYVISTAVRNLILAKRPEIQVPLVR